MVNNNPTYPNTTTTLHHTADYFPYGKVLREFVVAQERYILTGNERDYETTLDYFNARFYDSDFGRFLGVDPMAHIAPQMTPYHFVSNNPINRIDPLGLTDYEINKKGKITMVEGTETEDGTDRLIRGNAKYKNGELKGKEGKKYVTVEKEVFENLHADDNTTSFTMTSGENAENLFDFIAGYVGVEYGKADLVSAGGEKESVFITTYSNQEVGGMTEYLQKRKWGDPGLSLTSLTHNHPNTGAENMVGSYNPSGEPGGKKGDLPQARLLNNLFYGQKPPPQYFIWRNYVRTPYDANGVIKK